MIKISIIDMVVDEQMIRIKIASESKTGAGLGLVICCEFEGEKGGTILAEIRLDQTFSFDSLWDNKM